MPEMYFKQILDELCGCASFIIASHESREAAIVDPSVHLDEYVSVLHDRGFELRYVLDTHVHADHISGARELVKLYPAAKLCMHERAHVTFPFSPLSDKEELLLGQLVLRVMHTPGHRPELISLLVINRSRSPEPSMVLTGDCLLVGDVGRPDFGGGDADEQFDSITRLLSMPDWLAVFPGHFEGPCGQGMCGRPSSTIGFERRYNPLVGLGRASFIAALSSGIPPRPLNMLAIEATNRGHQDMAWAMLVCRQPVDEIGEDALEARDDLFLVDVREPQAYEGGHIPESINIPQADLASRLDEIPQQAEVAVTCQSGTRSLRAAQFLKQVGYPHVMTVSGGTDAWMAAGKQLARSQAFSSEENLESA